MKRELLEKTRAFEGRALPDTDHSRRPLFHVTGSTGWINDPNGFSVYEGEVHLFYQAHPYTKTHGPMHWGHIKTTDFVNWTYLPTALAPEEGYDRNGCFSGTAITLEDGRHLLMYTGVDEKGKDHTERKQTQCIATGDGIDYEKAAENPVIDASILPEGGSCIDFRDPKIWWHDGKYYCLCVNRLEGGKSAVLLFESSDALSWTYRGMPFHNDGSLGSMLECPDLFSLDGKDVLILSVQELPARDVLQEGYVTLFAEGRFLPEEARFETESIGMLDEGIDLYAAQTLCMPDGRRVMIAWMQNWETVEEYPEETDFNGQMTVPRELSYKNGRICQLPVREIEKLRTTHMLHEDVEVGEEIYLEGVRGRTADMTLTIRQGKGGYRKFRIGVAKDEVYVFEITIDLDAGKIIADRTKSRNEKGKLTIREFPFTGTEDEIRVRILLDRFSVELFEGEGEKAASFLLYTPQEAEGISFSSDGSALLTVDFYEMKKGGN